MNTGWAEGYVSDIEYRGGFYRDQAPADIDLMAEVAGFRPPAHRRDYAYCELGCGQGWTMLVLAAANPRASFVGIDFNPAHIARAREMAQAAGLENVRFLEMSFAEMAALPQSRLPDFDYITLHGIWSWVSAENQGHIVEVLRRWLKPGGLVYVSYNTMPGWAPALPLQRLLLEHARRSQERSDRRIREAIVFAEALKSAGARGLQNIPMLDEVVRERDEGSPVYLAHEYLNESWRPCHFADVAAAMAGAKLDYIGVVRLIENFKDLMLSPAQRQIVDAIADQPFREMIIDLCVDRRFRRDIYVRGARRLSEAERDERLARRHFALARPLAGIAYGLRVPAGEAQVERAVYEPVYAALAEGPRTLRELLEIARRHGDLTAVEAAGVIAGSQQALVYDPDEPGEATAFNNWVVAEMALEDLRSGVALATPRTGAGLHADVFDVLAWAAMCRQPGATLDELAGVVQGLLEARGEQASDRDGPITDPLKARQAILGRLEAIVADKLPLWRRLGAGGPPWRR
ncbi:MAG: methyltransferase regulatory domain-containing protein [Thalassobaculales bacterium]